MPLSAHEFERRLIFYASPTLTKLKVACIYNLNDLDDLEECIQYYNELLNKKDIYLKVLKIKGRSMIYVYQKEKLNKLCACKQIQNIFKQYDYNCTSLDTLILDLQKRLNDYDFPHEIGLFLGYPMTDVLGFIEGKEHLRTHRLYVCPQDSKELKRHLAFRDYLRKHPNAVKEYSKVKKEAAKLYPNDIEKYCMYKSQIIEKIYKEIGLK